MTRIQDVVVPTKGTAKYLNTRILPFDLEPQDGIQIYWSLHSEVLNDDPENPGQTISSPGVLLLDGRLHMTKEVYDNWGLDDTYVINWVATELSLTIV